MAQRDQKQPGNDEQPEPSEQIESEEHRELAATADADAGDAGDGEPESPPETARELTPEERVVQLEEELVSATDAVLRAQADAQNTSRRAEQDVEKARKFALERFAGDLLPVVDNLERALEAADGDEDIIKPIAEGVELTLKSFLDVLGKFNVEVVDPQGEPFDPSVHQAISMVENNDVEPNTVIAVMQKGYTLNGRLVRPAMVMVSKNGG